MIHQKIHKKSLGKTACMLLMAVAISLAGVQAA
jgi:hypothetical protein